MCNDIELYGYIIMPEASDTVEITNLIETEKVDDLDRFPMYPKLIAKE